jgi:hypothetical protein
MIRTNGMHLNVMANGHCENGGNQHNHMSPETGAVNSRNKIHHSLC